MRFKPEPVTDENLAEWKALEAAATGGFWKMMRDPNAPSDVGAEILAVGATKEACIKVVAYGDEDSQGGICSQVDAAFIEAARKAVPSLIEEVERLRAKVNA